jgi:hypothetical protein
MARIFVATGRAVPTESVEVVDRSRGKSVAHEDSVRC